MKLQYIVNNFTQALACKYQILQLLTGFEKLAFIQVNSIVCKYLEIWALVTRSFGVECVENL
jgi:hypothetical protein